MRVGLGPRAVEHGSPKQTPVRYRDTPGIRVPRQEPRNGGVDDARGCAGPCADPAPRWGIGAVELGKRTIFWSGLHGYPNVGNGDLAPQYRRGIRKASGRV